MGRSVTTSRIHPMSLLPNRFSAGLLIAALAILASGCSTLPRNPLPPGLSNDSLLPGYPKDIRMVLQMDALERGERTEDYDAFFRGLDFSGGKDGVFNLLQLSGGGEFGAFGAGLLNGMTETRKRPVFDMVTGVSTGALSAPMAFLGPEYDGILREAYTTISAKDIYRIYNLGTYLRGEPESVASSEPLFQMIERVMTLEMMEGIARGHREGRRLYMASSYLDDQRFVVWDIGAIANSGRDDALDLIHKIMLASASIPVVFPPVLFNVEHNGQAYDELHVDGGIFAPSIGISLLFSDSLWENATKNRNVYLVINNPLISEYVAVPRKVTQIGSHTLFTMLKNMSRWDVVRVFLVTEELGFDLYYHSVPADFERKTGAPFDKAYMNKLFDRGLELGRDRESWRTVDLEGPEESTANRNL